MDRFLKVVPQKLCPTSVEKDKVVIELPYKYKNNEFQADIKSLQDIKQQYDLELSKSDQQSQIKEKQEQYHENIISLLQQQDIYENIKILYTQEKVKDEFLIFATKKSIQKDILVKFQINQKCPIKQEEQTFKFELGKILYFCGDIFKVLDCVQIFDFNTYIQDQQQDIITAIEYDFSIFSLKNIIEARDKLLKQELKDFNFIQLQNQELKSLCQQIFQGVLWCHNQNTVIQNLSPRNILIRKHNYILIDYCHSSIQINQDQIFDIKESTDNMFNDSLIAQNWNFNHNIYLEQSYISPQIRQEINNKDNSNITIDPYKSDIYSLGLTLLHLSLAKLNKNDNIPEILQNPQESYNQAKNTIYPKLTFNNFLIAENNFVIVQDQVPYHYQVQDILTGILELEEKDRISSIKAALMSQFDKIILQKLEYSLFYRKYFPPLPIHEEDFEKYKIIQNFSISQQQQQQSDQKIIEYLFKPMFYKGSLSDKLNREGSGSLYKIQSDNQLQLLYQGTWKNDFPEGFGSVLLFQDKWFFEGQFTQGRLTNGEIKFQDKVMYKGDFYNYLLNQWMVKRDQASKFQVDTEYSIHLKPLQLQNSKNNLQKNDIVTEFMESQDTNIIIGGQQVYIKSIKNNFRVDDQVFDLFMQIPTPIHRINFQYFSDNSLMKLQHLIPNSPYFSELRILKMSIYSLKDAEFLISYLKSGNTQDLQELDLSDSPDLVLGSNEIAKVIGAQQAKLNNLKCLKLKRCQDSVQLFLRQLANQNYMLWKNMEELDFSNSIIDNKTFQAVFCQKKFQKLKKLVMKNPQKITSDGLQSLVSSIQNIKDVQYLDLTGMLSNQSSIGFFGDSNQDAFKKFVQALPNLQKLETLILDQAYINDNFIEYLGKSNLPSLKNLSFKFCTKVTFKGLFYLQVSQLLKNLQIICADYSGVALPKPTVERWNNVQLSIYKTTAIDQNNLYEYLKSAQKVQEITFGADQLNVEINSSLNVSKFKKVNLIIQSPQDIHNVFKFLKSLQNQELQVNFHEISIEQAYDIQNQMETYLKSKEIKEEILENVRINDMSLEVFFEKETITKINSKQFLNTYLNRQPDPPQILDGSHIQFKHDLYHLLNHQKTLTRNYFDLSQHYVSKQAINIVISSQCGHNFHGMNLSNSGIKSKQLIRLSKITQFKKIQNLVLKNVKDETLEGIQDLINSQQLPDLNHIELGHCNIEILIKNLLRQNSLVILTFSDTKVNMENPMKIDVVYNNNKSQSFSLFVPKGNEYEKPEVGKSGTLKIQINNFTKLKIIQEGKFKNISKSILEILRFTNLAKETGQKSINKQNNNSKEELKQVKIMVTGEDLSGKKALCTRWCFNQYDENYVDTQTMVRYFYKDIKAFDISGNLVPLRVNLTSISSLHQLQSLQRYLYQDIEGILVVFDITSDTIKEEITSFFDEFKLIKYEKLVCIVGNKKDLEKERTISEQEIQDLCKDLEIKYFEASALNGDNVETIFSELSLNCYKSKQSKPVFNNDQLLSLGQIISQFQLGNIDLKFNFLKSRSKLQSKYMEEICQKIGQNQNKMNITLVIKNWYAITEEEKQKITSMESEYLRIKLVNNRKRNFSNSLNSSIISTGQIQLGQSQLQQQQNDIQILEDNEIGAIQRKKTDLQEVDETVEILQQSLNSNTEQQDNKKQDQQKQIDDEEEDIIAKQQEEDGEQEKNNDELEQVEKEFEKQLLEEQDNEKNQENQKENTLNQKDNENNETDQKQQNEQIEDEKNQNKVQEQEEKTENKEQQQE